MSNETNDIAGELEALGEEWFLEDTPMRDTIERAAEEIRMLRRRLHIKGELLGMVVEEFEPHRIDVPPGYFDDWTMDKPTE